MTDAAHLLSDVSGFAVALFAGIYAAKKGGSSHSFGYAKSLACLIILRRLEFRPFPPSVH